MPRVDKNFKRLVRSRMATTGESYTSARSQLAAPPPMPIVERRDPLPSEGDVLVLARGLPQSVRSLRLSAVGSWDDYVRSLAWDRMSQVRARRPVPDGDARTREERGSLQAWLELDETTWHNRMGIIPFSVAPARWREERIVTDHRGEQTHAVDARSDRQAWHRDDSGPFRAASARLHGSAGPWSTWTFDPAWWKSSAAIVPERYTEVAGRPAIEVRLAGSVQLGDGMTSFGPADEHLLVIDLEFGLLLGRTGFFAGVPFVHWEVTEVVVNADLSGVAFDPPDDAQLEQEPERLQPRQFDDDFTLAAEAPFPIYVPSALPASYRLRHRSLLPGPHGVAANYLFQVGPDLRTGHFQMAEHSAEERRPSEIIWDEVPTDVGILSVSDVTPGPAHRIGWMTLGTTSIRFRGVIGLDELIGLSSSLRPVVAR